jgi:hypothetical protein
LVSRSSCKVIRASATSSLLPRGNSSSAAADELESGSMKAAPCPDSILLGAAGKCATKLGFASERLKHRQATKKSSRTSVMKSIAGLLRQHRSISIAPRPLFLFLFTLVNTTSPPSSPRPSRSKQARVIYTKPERSRKGRVPRK